MSIYNIEAENLILKEGGREHLEVWEGPGEWLANRIFGNGEATCNALWVQCSVEDRCVYQQGTVLSSQ